MDASHLSLKTKILSAVIGFSLCGILFFLVVKTQWKDFDFDQASKTLRELKQIDMQWTSNVFILTAGLRNDFDSVAEPLAAVESYHLLIADMAKKISDENIPWRGEFVPLVKNYEDLINRKISLIERIKSQHAILSNSTRMLPTAFDELINSRTDANVPGGDPALLPQMLTSLLNELMRFQRTPEASARQKIAEKLDELQFWVTMAPPETINKVKTIVAHTNLVLSQRELGDKLLHDLEKLPTIEVIDKLSDAYSKAHNSLLAQQQTYKTVLIVYASCLLLLISYMAWLLIQSNSRLNARNAQLRQANSQTQLQLIQSAKMAAMGRMAAGIAHEINTPLAYVKATLEILKEQLVPEDAGDSTPRTEELNALFVDGIYGIQQISTLVLTLKNFSRLDQVRITEFSVEDGLDSTLLLARYTLKNVADVEKRYSGVPKISCSPAQINQVFLNVILNAVHAMEAHAKKGLLTISTMQEDDDFVKVTIQDTGHGIPSQILPRIFDPFFTTKKIGEGSGTGLATSFLIIQNHGGNIKVESTENVGTKFSILLPIKGALKKSAFEAETGLHSHA